MYVLNIQEYGEDIIYVNWKWSEQVIKDSKAYIQDCDIITANVIIIIYYNYIFQIIF